MKDSRELFRNRRAGLLLPLFSLQPVRTGTVFRGVLGEPVRNWLRFMETSGCSVWQMLPPGPTQADRSPYNLRSAFALDPAWIDLDELVLENLLTEPELACAELGGDRAILLGQAAHNFFEDGGADRQRRKDYADFLSAESGWLDDYCLFESISREQSGEPWWLWPAPLRDRDAEALRSVWHRHPHWIRQYRFEQYLARHQWRAMRQHANRLGILLFGDMPLPVSRDSADCWAHRELFRVTRDGQMEYRLGVPPNVFTEAGQDWGMPAYRWDECGKENYEWWRNRVRQHRNWFDLLKIHHFRGISECWEIPVWESHPCGGAWVSGPGHSLVEAIRGSAGPMPLIADNLGDAMESAEHLRLASRLPGMTVLQLAFDGNSNNHHLPHHHFPNSVVYTGTHDNNTSLAWLGELDETRTKQVNQYCGHSSDPFPIPIIREALRSVARLAIIPMQDWLMLGGEARINTPGQIRPENWQWQVSRQQLSQNLAAGIRDIVRLYGRETG